MSRGLHLCCQADLKKQEKSSSPQYDVNATNYIVWESPILCDRGTRAFATGPVCGETVTTGLTGQ